jgi:molybdopterin-synthase adenylyltransferase
MKEGLEAEILAASQPLRLPGGAERRVLSPFAVERLALDAEVAPAEVEALALESGITPLHYLRNLATYGAGGQVSLLRSTVAVVGHSGAVQQTLELLAGSGVGRILLCTPSGYDLTVPPETLAQAARNQNSSCRVELRRIALQEGNPAAVLQGAGAVAGCLDRSNDEQLLQFACRMLRIPLVLAAASGRQGQGTTILPGDPGVALVYKPAHPHLDPDRIGYPADTRAALMVGTWLAEQLTRLVTGEGELLRGKLLFADLDRGEMEEYPLH